MIKRTDIENSVFKYTNRNKMKEYKIEGECPFNTCLLCYFYGIFCNMDNN